MRIYGVDFTSTPAARKPITCALGELDGTALRVRRLQALTSLRAFEQWLAMPGPWTAGLDFPFSQPRRFIEAMGWPVQWEALVAHLAGLTRDEFKALIKTYRDARPPGDKHHPRTVDAKAGSKSPMMVFGVPVGLMFHEGVPRLARAGVSVVPCRRNDDARVALEVYPGLAARTLIGRTPYKNDANKPGEEARREARASLLRSLSGGGHPYAVRVSMNRALRETLIEDAKADWLDAVLCAVQAAWAVRQGPGHGVPESIDTLEGWIADPALYE
ncbi:MAG: DUF429 domain-containing protein [Gammaproteobacteria bacterium]|nr:DUF429 domain-containing protein [Gammaproteobacteria bacterium]